MLIVMKTYYHVVVVWQTGLKEALVVRVQFHLENFSLHKYHGKNWQAHWKTDQGCQRLNRNEEQDQV